MSNSTENATANSTRLVEIKKRHPDDFEGRRFRDHGSRRIDADDRDFDRDRGGFRRGGSRGRPFEGQRDFDDFHRRPFFGAAPLIVNPIVMASPILPGVLPGIAGGFPGMLGGFPGAMPGIPGGFPGAAPGIGGGFPGAAPGFGGGFPGAAPGIGGGFPGATPGFGGGFAGNFHNH